MVKEYETYRSAAKTAKANGLVMADKERLFDFSLLDELDIKEWEKERLKEDAIQSVNVCFCEQFYMGEHDPFTRYNGTALYYRHKVYSTQTWKRCYVIFQLGKVKHDSLKRKSVYDEYFDATTHKADGGYEEPFSDIEI